MAEVRLVEGIATEVVFELHAPETGTALHTLLPLTSCATLALLNPLLHI